LKGVNLSGLPEDDIGPTHRQACRALARIFMPSDSNDIRRSIMRTSTTLQESAVRQNFLQLSPKQAQAVSGGTGIPILVWEEGKPIRIERIYHPYLPTFPIKDLGALTY
jgi:hypothetical protein